MGSSALQHAVHTVRTHHRAHGQSIGNLRVVVVVVSGQTTRARVAFDFGYATCANIGSGIVEARPAKCEDVLRQGQIGRRRPRRGLFALGHVLFVRLVVASFPMLPRVTKISWLVSGNVAAVQQEQVPVARLYGTEHQCIVVAHNGPVRVRQTVVYLPRGLLLSEQIARALRITAWCRTVTRRNGAVGETFLRVVALRWANTIVNGIAVPWRDVVAALGLQTTPTDQRPAASLVVHALHFRRSKPAALQRNVDLLENPALLRVLLGTPLWIAERTVGSEIEVLFDAETQHVRIVPPSFEQTSRDMADTLRTIARQVYGYALDLVLSGVVDSSGTVRFHSLHVSNRSRDYLMAPDAFLPLCAAYSVPVARTVHAGRTLRSVINERLTRRRPVLPFGAGTTRRHARARGGGGGSDDDDSASASHSSSSSSSNSSNGDGSSVQTHFDHEFLRLRVARHSVGRRDQQAPEAQVASVATADSSTSWRSNRLQPNSTSARTTTTTVQGSAFDDTRYGGIADERIDWARCAALVAQQICERAPGQLLGFMVQAYTNEARVQWLQQFAYMRYRCGAEVWCDEALLRL